MELEDRLALRLAYITSLPPLLEAAGLRMCRWSKRLLRVCGCYLEVAGYSEQEEAQHALLVREPMLIVFIVKTHHAHGGTTTTTCYYYSPPPFCLLNISCLNFSVESTQEFDKVWHPGLLLEFRKILPCAYYIILKSYLMDRLFQVKFKD